MSCSELYIHAHGCMYLHIHVYTPHSRRREGRGGREREGGKGGKGREGGRGEGRSEREGGRKRGWF